MLDAHMDEVGFMIVDDDGEGLYRFETVGGIDARHLVGKQVYVGKERTPGCDWRQAHPLDEWG